MNIFPPTAPAVCLRLYPPLVSPGRADDDDIVNMSLLVSLLLILGTACAEQCAVTAYYEEVVVTGYGRTTIGDYSKGLSVSTATQFVTLPSSETPSPVQMVWSASDHLFIHVQVQLPNGTGDPRSSSNHHWLHSHQCARYLPPMLQPRQQLQRRNPTHHKNRRRISIPPLVVETLTLIETYMLTFTVFYSFTGHYTTSRT